VHRKGTTNKFNVDKDGREEVLDEQGVFKLVPCSTTCKKCKRFTKKKKNLPIVITIFLE
jgi:hypothetical protein